MGRQRARCGAGTPWSEGGRDESVRVSHLPWVCADSGAAGSCCLESVLASRSSLVLLTMVVEVRI